MRGADPLHVPQVRLIHPDQIIEFPVILPLHTSRSLPRAGDACRCQLLSRSGMYRVSGLLIGGRRGFDIKFSGKVVFCHEVFKVELGEWASADVAEANKKYFYNCLEWNYANQDRTCKA